MSHPHSRLPFFSSLAPSDEELRIIAQREAAAKMTEEASKRKAQSEKDKADAAAKKEREAAEKAAKRKDQSKRGKASAAAKPKPKKPAEIDDDLALLEDARRQAEAELKKIAEQEAALLERRKLIAAEQAAIAEQERIALARLEEMRKTPFPQLVLLSFANETALTLIFEQIEEAQSPAHRMAMIWHFKNLLQNHLNDPSFAEDAEMGPYQRNILERLKAISAKHNLPIIEGRTESSYTGAGGPAIADKVKISFANTSKFRRNISEIFFTLCEESPINENLLKSIIKIGKDAEIDLVNIPCKSKAPGSSSVIEPLPAMHALIKPNLDGTRTDLNLLKVLVENGADVNRTDLELREVIPGVKGNLLVGALELGNIEAIKYLFIKGGDVEPILFFNDQPSASEERRSVFKFAIQSAIREVDVMSRDDALELDRRFSTTVGRYVAQKISRDDASIATNPATKVGKAEAISAVTNSGHSKTG